MKLYWPMAICDDGYTAHTYDSCLTLDECKKVFKCWEEGYNYRLRELWVEVADPMDDGYCKRINVKKDYIFEEEL